MNFRQHEQVNLLPNEQTKALVTIVESSDEILVTAKGFP